VAVCTVLLHLQAHYNRIMPFHFFVMCSHQLLCGASSISLIRSAKWVGLLGGFMSVPFNGYCLKSAFFHANHHPSLGFILPDCIGSQAKSTTHSPAPTRSSHPEGYSQQPLQHLEYLASKPEGISYRVACASPFGIGIQVVKHPLAIATGRVCNVCRRSRTFSIGPD
jgi:hypothetical protein